MRKLMIATAAATALLAGASVANAQTFYSEGYVGDDYYGRPMIDRGVGLQIGPFGAGVYADTPEWGYARPYSYLRGDHPQSTYNSRAFRSQEVWPQSPPGGS